RQRGEHLGDQVAAEGCKHDPLAQASGQDDPQALADIGIAARHRDGAGHAVEGRRKAPAAPEKRPLDRRLGRGARSSRQGAHAAFHGLSATVAPLICIGPSALICADALALTLSEADALIVTSLPALILIAPVADRVMSDALFSVIPLSFIVMLLPLA